MIESAVLLYVGWIGDWKSKTIIEIILFVLHQQFFPYLFTVKSIAISTKKHEQQQSTTFIRILKISIWKRSKHFATRARESKRNREKKVRHIQTKENWITPYLVKFHVYGIWSSGAFTFMHTYAEHVLQSAATTIAHDRSHIVKLSHKSVWNLWVNLPCGW